MAASKTSLALLVAASLAVTSTAHPEFRQKIPNAFNVKGVDAIGHVDPEGGGPRNKFGLAFAANGLEWSKALCEADSDGDGQTNGQELGDPCCEWVQGKNPTVLWTAGVSAPGDAASKSDPKLWASVNCNSTSTANSTAPGNSTNASATSEPVATTAMPLNTTASTTEAPATTTSAPATTTKAPNTTVPTATKSGADGVSARLSVLAVGVVTTVAVLFV